MQIILDDGLMKFFFGMAVMAYLLYTHSKLLSLEQKINKIPSIEDMAKEIIKVKLPISELPQEMKEMLAQYVAEGPKETKPLNTPITKNKESYIG